MDMSGPGVICFGGFTLDRARCVLTRGATKEIALRPKAFDLLCYLAERPGRLLSKDELLLAIWPGVFVTDDSLVQCIGEIRAVLGDEARRIIKTVPRRGYVFAAETTTATASAALTASGPAAKPVSAGRSSGFPAIAIAPFAATSDAGQAIAAALRDELIEQLHRHRLLRVLDRHPVRLAEPADSRESRGRYVLHGGVRAACGQIHVSARLVDSLDDGVIWAGHFDADGTALAAWGDLARAIAAQIVPELERGSSGAAAVEHAAAPSAWQAYQWGVQELFAFKAETIGRAVGHFEQAIALEGDFAPAHARLAYAQLQLAWYGDRTRRLDRAREAEATARRALSFDAQQALALVALGRALVFLGRPEDGIAALSAALDANPSLPQGHFALGQALVYRDRAAQAATHLLEAIRLGPHDPHLWTFQHVAAWALARLGDMETAERHARRAILHANATYWAFATLVMVLGARGKAGEAAPYVRELTARVPHYSCGLADADLGDRVTRAVRKDYLAGLQDAGIPMS